jgi:hypothetical protein
MKALSKLALHAVAIVLLLVNQSLGQIGGGSIVGSVLDSSGAAIVGAKVTATNVATNEVSTTVTNATGYYEFPILPAGRYVLEAENPGFEKAKTAEFSLNSGTRPRFDLSMVVGQATQSVEVVGVAPLVNSTTADLGIVVDQSKVEALPLNGRDFQQLVGLQPGVYSAPTTLAGLRGGIEFNGASAFGNNLLMDGVDMSFGENSASASDKAAGTEVGTIGAHSGASLGRGSLINTISVEAVQEFKSTGSAFSAEYGRATGGVLNMVTKSGTNQFHGTLFDFFRNDALDANSFFSNLSGFPKPPLRWNQYGANLGGPIIHDKLFFFFNYEGVQAKQNAAQVGNVPTPLLLGMVTPALRQNLGFLPPPTAATSNPLVGIAFENLSRTNDENTFVSRVDMDLGKQRLAFRYDYNHQNFTTPNLIPISPSTFPTRFHNALIADTATISPTMVNELRLGFNRLDEFRHDAAYASDPQFIGVGGDGGFGTGMDYLRFDSSSYTVADNFTVVHGAHTVKTGFEIRSLQTHRQDFFNPSAYYLDLPELIADTPISITINLDGSKALHNIDYGFFVQDNWRLSKRLQVNAGLRYEYFSPFAGGWNVTANSTSYFNPTYNTKKGDPLYQPDHKDFSPRLGLVFDVFGNQKLIVRAGGALTYNPPQAFLLYDLNYGSNPYLPGFASFLAGDLPPSVSLKFPFDPSFISQAVGNPSLLPKGVILGESLLDPHMKTERSGTWNLSLQRVLTSNLAVQASYVGTRNWDQYASRNLNLFNPVLNNRLDPNVGDVTLIEYAGRSSYHALQLSVNQRLQHGVALDFYYTYAKSLSYDSADSFPPAVQDANSIKGSYGPKVSDLRHDETLILSYAVPSPRFAGKSRSKGALLSGWTVQAIQNGRSGLPINVLAGVDEAGIQTAGYQRPDVVPGVKQYIRNMSNLQWLNPAAFDITTPTAQQRYGNLGFNALRGPGALTLDLALHKTFKVREKQTLTFRVEAFNFLNHPVFNNPVSSVADPTFGFITGANDGRNVQLALKYVF